MCYRRLCLILLVLTLIVSITDCARGVEHKTLKVRFSSAKGIREGAVVLCLGVEVGKVSKIEVQRDGVILLLDLAKGNAPLRSGDRIELVNQGLLGDKAVQIEPGPDTSPMIGPNEILQGAEPSDSDILVSALIEILSASPNDRDQVMKKWKEWLQMNHLWPSGISQQRN